MHDVLHCGQVSDLGKPDALLLLAMRWWVEERLAGRSALARLRGAMARADAADAAYSVDGLMEIILRTARRPVAMHGPRCHAVSGDERDMLRAAALAQSGYTDQAAQRLGDMLAPSGVRFAIGPLAGLGQVFASAGLLLGVPRVMAVAWACAPASRALH